MNFLIALFKTCSSFWCSKLEGRSFCENEATPLGDFCPAGTFFTGRGGLGMVPITNSADMHSANKMHVNNHLVCWLHMPFIGVKNNTKSEINLLKEKNRIKKNSRERNVLCCAQVTEYSHKTTGEIFDNEAKL
jgi:hypothetical protein